MSKLSKIILPFVLMFVLLTIAATYYKTVVLQDFEVSGMGVEVSEDYTYAYFVYDGEEYEIELESDDFASLEIAAQEVVGSIDKAFIEQLEIAFAEAETSAITE